jgi:nitrous oxidase accessory protein NosD
MRRLMRPLLITIAALSMLVAVSPARAREKIVVRPGESIQAAVDAAAPGDTIHVRRGIYRESVVVSTDELTLRGHHAVLEPPAPTQPNPCADFGSGICLVGEGDFDAGVVSDYVEDVTVRGFEVRGFGESGILAAGARDATFKRNDAQDNVEYGIFAFSSIGTRILFNRTFGSDVAGIYIGDSPEANATVRGNRTYDNMLGVFIRNALHGELKANSVRDNCIGVVFLADAPGPAGEFLLRHNKIRHNNKACPAGAEGPPLSGAGVVLFGATGVTLRHNLIVGNVPSGESAVSGGVAVISGDAGTPPTNNVITRNVIRRNEPDIFWDESGSGNVFSPNVCRTSVPARLCD